MIRTHGLTHLNLVVADLDRTLRFYAEAFGVKEYFRDEHSVQVLGPGPHDIIAFERGTPMRAAGITHFGFRLVSAEEIDAAVEQATRAGGTLSRRGEFAPGLPYAYIHDPDGYEIELWFEPEAT
jgi:catechol 2,3-dioxygenase-like lactoylglutathione lyase family enzyme